MDPGSLPWGKIATTSTSLAFQAFKNRNQIQKSWIQFLVAVGKGNTQVVITGRPAVGKSVLQQRLHGATKDTYWKLPETSTKVETEGIDIGTWKKIVRVIPGQTSRTRDEGMNQAFSDNPDLQGVIHVVDWGYTTVRDETVRNKRIEKDGIDTIDKLRAFNLSREVEAWLSEQRSM